MVLNIDSSRALRTHDQLAHLADAVLSADSSDESRSIEWKSQYANLLAPEAGFAIGRAVLGMANRPIAAAQSHFEGVGYVLVGVEPGHLHGQIVPDSATVANSIGRYAGNSWPLWDTRTVGLRGQQILVVTVEPPRPGDRIALLQKSFQPARGPEVTEGTIFVRQSGFTDRAKRHDIEQLQERLLAGAATQAEATRGLDRDRQLRSLVAEMVHAIHHWASVMETLVIMTARETWGQQSLMDWTTTAPASTSGDAMQLAKLNMSKIRLETKDSQLLELVTRAEQAIEAMSLGDALRSGPSAPEAREIAYGHIRNVKEAFDNIASAARTVFAD
ncbi:hypothetical protein [Microbacterium sp. SL75]|uniref:hypothetical protein n=1 Tax=Microbacterium sp. SL75 TaxID=2995140 RepID=UPI00226F4209|nr:hypothetical protein [Microbacterium sp. SL75]WAC69231.1 hypothetical protein OVA17_00585 [Microbacterium sp. SL75]